MLIFQHAGFEKTPLMRKLLSASMGHFPKAICLNEGIPLEPGPWPWGRRPAPKAKCLRRTAAVRRYRGGVHARRRRSRSPPEAPRGLPTWDTGGAEAHPRYHRSPHSPRPQQAARLANPPPRFSLMFVGECRAGMAPLPVVFPRRIPPSFAREVPPKPCLGKCLSRFRNL